MLLLHACQRITHRFNSVHDPGELSIATLGDTEPPGVYPGTSTKSGIQVENVSVCLVYSPFLRKNRLDGQQNLCPRRTNVACGAQRYALTL